MLKSVIDTEIHICGGTTVYSFDVTVLLVWFVDLVVTESEIGMLMQLSIIITEPFSCSLTVVSSVANMSVSMSILALRLSTRWNSYLMCAILSSISGRYMLRVIYSLT